MRHDAEQAGEAGDVEAHDPAEMRIEPLIQDANSLIEARYPTVHCIEPLIQPLIDYV